MKNKPFLLAAATNYGDAFVRQILHTYKYGGVTSFSVPLAKLLTRHLVSLPIPDLKSYTIIPVPLHPSKKKYRGFNQSELIAKQTAHDLGVLCDTAAVVRCKRTRTQANITDTKEREANMRGCFRVADPASICGKNIIVVDDIFTSGATMTEIVRMLRAADARRVIGAVVAKS